MNGLSILSGMRAVLLVLLAITTVSWTPLMAAETGCLSPTSLTLPAGLTDDTDASRVSSVVESALSTGLGNLKCIHDALERKDLTAEERQKLEQAHEAQLAAMRAIADRWNGLYTSHAKRKAKE